MGRGLGVAIERGAHPAAAQLRRPQPIGQAVHIRHQHSPQLPPGTGDQRRQVGPTGPQPLGGIEGHHVGTRCPNGADLLPARGDVHRTVGKAALPQAHDQGLRAATAHRTDVLRALQPHATGTVAQAGLRHRGDHRGIAQGRSLRGLHGHDQAPGADLGHGWGRSGRRNRKAQAGGCWPGGWKQRSGVQLSLRLSRGRISRNSPAASPASTSRQTPAVSSP